MFGDVILALYFIFFLLGFAVPPDSVFYPLVSLFSNADVLFLLLNSLFIVLLSYFLENRIGRIKFVSIYVLCGIVGNIGLFTIGSAIGAPVMGADAGIYGLFGVLIALNPTKLIAIEIYPMPAFVAAIFLIVTRFLITQNLALVPFLLGLAIGYLLQEVEIIEQKTGGQVLQDLSSQRSF